MEHQQPIAIYAYTKGNGIVPSSTDVYGQTSNRVVVQPNRYIEFVVKRSERRFLDKPTQRCDKSGSTPSPSKCGGQFLEKIFPCSPRFLMSNPKQKTCSINSNWSGKNYTDLRKIIEDMKSLEDHEIFEKSGCMPSCSRSKFELNIESKSVIPGIPKGTELAILSFVYEKGEYQLMEEHYLYGIWNFIPDVGGYLGLLLGYSLLSLYHLFTDWLIDAKKWLLQ